MFKSCQRKYENVTAQSLYLSPIFFVKHQIVLDEKFLYDLSTSIVSYMFLFSSEGNGNNPLTVILINILLYNFILLFKKSSIEIVKNDI